jgi:hypothetical protein
MTRYALLFCAALYAAFVWPAAAQNDTPVAEAQSTNPVETLRVETDRMLKGLGEEELKFMYATSMRDGAVRAVIYIQDLVAGAVEACGEAQPDMKESLETRYKQWREAIDPRLEQAQANLNETIDSHKKLNAQRIRDHLKLVHEAAEYTRGQHPRDYVTDEKACTYLLENMDKTEQDLSEKLQATLTAIPLPAAPPQEEAAPESSSGDETAAE